MRTGRSILKRGAKAASAALALLSLALSVEAAVGGGQAAPAAGGPRAMVTLRSESSVRGPEIRLGDVADIAGQDAELLARLRGLEVGRAALPGMTRSLDLPYLMARLRLSRVDPAAVLLDGPGVATIRTESQTVTGEQLFAAVRQHLLAGRDARGGEIEIRPSGPMSGLTLPVGILEIRIRVQATGELRGTVSPTVELWVDGVLARSLCIPVRVSLLTEVLVAARPIARHAVLGAEDVRAEQRELQAGQEPARETKLVIGRRAVRAIQPGEPIQPVWLELPPLVHRGDLVQLRVEGRGLRAAAPGEAREEGKAGQVIRVKNLASGREVYGQVDAEGSIRIPF